MHRVGHGAIIALAAAALAGCEGTVVGEASLVVQVHVSVARQSLRVGDTTAVVAEAYDARGRLVTDRGRAPRLVSRDPSVLVVAELTIARVGPTGRGTARALAPGHTWIVASSGGRSDSVAMLVTP